MKSRQHLTTLKRALCNMLKRRQRKKGRDFHGWEQFQKDSAKTLGQLMLSAPTGSGKTEAALLWSNKNQCATLGNRVFYVLPYTASINAMYDRLKELVSDDKIGMLHGKAAYFIYQTLADKDYTYQEAAAEVREQQDLTRENLSSLQGANAFSTAQSIFRYTRL